MVWRAITRAEWGPSSALALDSAASASLASPRIPTMLTSSTPHPSEPRLPAELQRYILQLASQRVLDPTDSDPARSSVLRSFALVSRAWGDFAQYELFGAEVVVLEHPHVAAKFLGALALDRTGRLANMVSRMRVKGATMGGFDNSGTSYRLGELQDACPNLDQLALQSLVFSLDSLRSSQGEPVRLQFLGLIPTPDFSCSTKISRPRSRNDPPIRHAVRIRPQLARPGRPLPAQNVGRPGILFLRPSSQPPIA